MCCGGIFDYENRKERLTEVELEEFNDLDETTEYVCENAYESLL